MVQMEQASKVNALIKAQNRIAGSRTGKGLKGPHPTDSGKGEAANQIWE
jgi:hypothetical protein